MTDPQPDTVAVPAGPDHSWFRHDRLGMFVHWGLYALAARHEWVMQREHIAVEDYERYAQYFEADRYDPDAWAAAAREAGMPTSS